LTNPITDYLRRWQARFRWLAARPVGVALALGVVLRLFLYFDGRGLWLDELSLRDNLSHRAARDLFATFTHTQLCPPAFFAVEWAVARVLGTGALALKLVPLLGGLAALFGFAALARRTLPAHAAWVAVWLFAVSGDLVVYASEAKPYSTDVAAAVVCTWAGLAIATVPVSRRRFLGFTALGAGLLWFSFPAALVLAGVGSSLILSAVVERDRPRVAALVLTAAGWAASFAAEHAVAVRMLGTEGSHGMQAFWNFAFPPWPPASWRDLAWPLRESVRLFDNPLDYYGPFGPWLASLPVVSLFAVGVVWLWRRDRRWLGMLILPLLFTLGVAYPRLYPFHGRLVLFLVPALILLIAEGTSLVWDLTRARAPWLHVLVLATVLLAPTSRALFWFVEPRTGTEHNGVGDLRPWGHEWQRFPF
jgi:hypothetical protein